jgi:hypothetical protein
MYHYSSTGVLVLEVSTLFTIRHRGVLLRSDKFVRNKFERWNLRQRPERRRAGRPKSLSVVRCHERISTVDLVISPSFFVG